MICRIIEYLKPTEEPSQGIIDFNPLTIPYSYSELLQSTFSFKDFLSHARFVKDHSINFVG